MRPQVVVEVDAPLPYLDSSDTVVHVWVRVGQEWQLAQWRYLGDDEVEPGVTRAEQDAIAAQMDSRAYTDDHND